jgi:hypothetical protein
MHWNVFQLKDNLQSAVDQYGNFLKFNTSGKLTYVECCFLPLKTGCQWHTQPCGFQKRQRICLLFFRKKEDGTFEEIYKNLRDRCRKRRKKRH